MNWRQWRNLLIYSKLCFTVILVLLVPDGLDRVEVGGFAGGVPTEEDADDRADKEWEDDAPGLYEDRIGQDSLDYVRGRHSKDNP